MWFFSFYGLCNYFHSFLRQPAASFLKITTAAFLNRFWLMCHLSISNTKLPFRSKEQQNSVGNLLHCEEQERLWQICSELIIVNSEYDDQKMLVGKVYIYIYIYIYIRCYQCTTSINGGRINYKYIIATNSSICIIKIFRLYNMKDNCLMLHLYDR